MITFSGTKLPPVEMLDQTSVGFRWQMHMSGWFAKSKQTTIKKLAEDPQPFDVRCECGQGLSGVRQSSHQIVYCDECGTATFVLPADTYPATVPAKGRKQKKRKRPTPPVAVDIPESNFVKPTVEPIVETNDSESVDVDGRAESDALGLSPSKSPRSFITPFRAIIVLTVAIATLTIWWGLRVRSLDKAASTFQTARKAGQEALSNGEMATAAAHYREACDAMHVLGRTDATARQTCQLAQETQAAANLTVHPLMKIIERARQTLSGVKTDEERLEAEAHALDLYVGQWIVMEANLYSIGDTGGSMRRMIDYPVTVGEMRVEIDAELQVFNRLPSRTGSQRVILAAQLDKCRMSGDALVIELVDETAFLWQNANTLKMVGLLAEDDEQRSVTLALLEQQSRMVEPPQ